jgi:hypothetical protein
MYLRNGMIIEKDVYERKNQLGGKVCQAVNLT